MELSNLSQPTKSPLQTEEEFQESLQSKPPQEEAEVSPPSSEEEPEAKEGGEDLDLEGILSELPEDEAPVTKEEAGPPDFTKPEFAKLTEDFKTAMGVDLKEAYETFTQTAAELRAATAKLQEMESRQTLSELQDAWDVTPKELDRRVNEVLKVYAKMSPAQVEKYNSLEGVQQIWAKIEGKKAGSVTPSSGGKRQATSERRFKQSEIKKMMFENPALYDQNQALIAAALKDNRVDYDQ